MTSCSGDDPAEVAAVAASGATSFFLELSGGGDYGRGDLYELVRGGGGGIAAPSPAPPHRPEVLPVSPSEDEMATWLHKIVTGGQEQYAGDEVDNAAAGPVADDRLVQAKEPKLTTEKWEKLPTTERNFNCTYMDVRQDTTGDSNATRKTARRARMFNSGTHSQTEKRRRSKINERLKTLQQLVPGSRKSNQASTLDQTIRYVKSLQQQVQAMSSAVVGYSMVRTAVTPPPAAVAARPPMPPAAAAIAPAMHARPGVFLGPTPMVTFGPMLPAHHPALIYPAGNKSNLP